MNPVKVINTKYNVLELFKNRWSTRAFSNKEISKDEINTLIEAATLSFSAGNTQPWRFIIGLKNTNGFEKIFSELAGGNQPWAKNASALIVTIAQMETEDGKPMLWAMHDVGAANMQLALQATSMDLNCHVMGGFNQEGLHSKLNLNAHQKIATVMAIGYYDNELLLDEPFKSRELTSRTRLSVEEVATIL
jgi:nitroreductase